MMTIQLTNRMVRKMRKTFKDFVKEDLNVFFNANEFSEEVEIDGKMIEIVRGSNAINSSDGSRQLASYDLVFHTVTTSFEHMPQPETWMEFDGEEYRILSVVENDGVLTIGLSRHDA